MKLRSLLLTVAFIMSSSLSCAKVIIWDIGDVLFEKSTFGFMKSIGISRFLGHILIDWKNPFKLESVLFEVLYGLECAPLPDTTLAHTAHGVPLPPVMCHWQTGTLTGPEIIKLAKPHIKALAEQGFFTSHRERKLIEKTISAMFNPKTLAYNMRPIRAGVRILEQCAQELNPDGSVRNYLIALSNWDPVSFDIFHELNKETFSHFDELVISGKTGLIKPRREAFQYLIDTHKIDPEECLVIDDQEINLFAAEALGFNTFHIKKGNYRELRQVLSDFGALLS